MIFQDPTFKIHRKNNGFGRIFKIMCFRKRLPKWTNLNSQMVSKIQKKLEIIFKSVPENESFFNVDFSSILMDSGAQNHPKTRTGLPPSTPRALMEHLLRTPGAQKAPRTQFLMVSTRFGIDFERIWAPKWIPKCFQNMQNLHIAKPLRLQVFLGIT